MQVQSNDYVLVSDLTGNCYVSLEELEVLTGYWLNTNCGGADFAPVDGDVDFEDFSDFYADWMMCNNPVDSACIKN